MDDILSHRSEDRRRIFEEASGIVKFKTRKEESERKLLQTEQNLIRINDIIQELSERIEPLSQQAETARQFLRLSDELKTQEIALILDTIDQHEQTIAQAKEEKLLLENDWMIEQDNWCLARRTSHRDRVDPDNRAADRSTQRPVQPAKQPDGVALQPKSG